MLLEGIKEPSDIRLFDLEEKQRLAQEIRERIISVMSINGGHLGSNLGVVELTMALHEVFDSPKDALVFDTSHQTYPHKLLTGRNERFHTIRKSKGLSGFAHPKESSHDPLFAGHAGNALSMALGLAKARDQCHENHAVLAILGDADLTCGLTLEALNNMPHKLRRFIVVLNDNKMAISKNVGNVTRILSRIVNNPKVNKLNKDLEASVARIPHFGELLAKQGQKITESIKNLVSPAIFFEQYGLSYLGPFDGHNLEELISIFEAVKDLSWPVLVHVHTEKGKGMPLAVENPTLYHGASPFDVKTGCFLPPKSTVATFPQVCGSALFGMAKKDPSLITITPAMPAGSCLEPLMQTFPDRCLDVGIAEGHALTFAGGLSHNKKLKVCAIVYSSFLQRGLDMVFHDICIQDHNVVLCIDRAGLATGDGISAHGIYDIGFLKAMPNMVICQPRNARLLRELLHSAFSWERPVALRYPNLGADEDGLQEISRPCGRGEIIKEGKEVAIIALGHLVKEAHKLSFLLEKEGLKPTIVDPIFVKPLDEGLFIELFATHSTIIVLEEHSITCGLSSSLCDFVVQRGLSNRLYCFGVPDIFFDHGAHADLLNDLGLSAEKIMLSLNKRGAFSQNHTHDRVFA